MKQDPTTTTQPVSTTTVQQDTIGKSSEPGGTCSGSAALGALSVEGLAPRAATTVLAIDAAASICDWVALGGLMTRTFNGPLDREVVLAGWQAQESTGEPIMQALRQELRQPYARTSNPAFYESYLWPAQYWVLPCEPYFPDFFPLPTSTLSDEELWTVCYANGNVINVLEDGRWTQFDGRRG